jgi:glycosyltransferase involved in cell wall biosynthesis
MKILMICDYIQPLGGTEQYLLSISAELEKLGNQVHFFYGIKADRTMSCEQRRAYFFPEIIQSDGRLKQSEVEHIRKALSEIDPDVAYFHNVPNFSLIRMVADSVPSCRYVHDHRLFCPKGDKMFLLSGKTCHHPSGIGCYLNNLWRGCLHPLPHITLPLIKHNRQTIKAHSALKLIVASEYMRICLKKNGLVDSSIYKIPYFSNLPDCESTRFENFVLFGGRLIRQKGLGFLIRSMKFWSESLRLVVAGDGPQRKQLTRLAAKTGVAERVKFLGSISNTGMQRYYERCLCLAVPSVWDEPFGIVGIEAMQCGKPVVAFDVGGVPEWLENGKSGFMVPRKDVQALGEAINRLFNNRGIAEKMGIQARQLYQEKFHKDHHIRHLMQLFKSLRLPGNSAPHFTIPR